MTITKNPNQVSDWIFLLFKKESIHRVQKGTNKPTSANWKGSVSLSPLSPNHTARVMGMAKIKYLHQLSGLSLRGAFLIKYRVPKIIPVISKMIISLNHAMIVLSIDNKSSC